MTENSNGENKRNLLTFKWLAGILLMIVISMAGSGIGIGYSHIVAPGHPASLERIAASEKRMEDLKVNIKETLDDIKRSLNTLNMKMDGHLMQGK
jgi:hypothetical protein